MDCLEFFCGSKTEGSAASLIGCFSLSLDFTSSVGSKTPPSLDVIS